MLGVFVQQMVQGVFDLPVDGKQTASFSIKVSGPITQAAGV